MLFLSTSQQKEKKAIIERFKSLHPNLKPSKDQSYQSFGFIVEDYVRPYYRSYSSLLSRDHKKGLRGFAIYLQVCSAIKSELYRG